MTPLDGPLIVQSDKTLLLEVDHARRRRVPARRSRRSPSSSARPSTSTPTGSPRWGCGTRARPGTTPSRSSTRCSRYSRYPVPHALLVDVAETMARYGRLRLIKHPAHGLVLHATDRAVLEEVLRSQEGRAAASARASTRTPSSCTRPSAATSSRCCSSSAGRPRTSPATSTARRTRSTCAEDGWALRPYQREAAEGFWHGGSGVVVLPCGAGKTLVGAAAMAQARATTLILVTNTVAARQWRDELLKRTSLTEDEIGEYSGARKEIRPVTIATYQVMTTRRKGVYAAPRAVRRARLGPDRLRRGAPAARADLPVHRRHPGAPPARPDRDAGARGRPRGRRVLADRPEALRRAVEGDRGAGLHRAGRLRRGPRDAARRASGWRTRWPSRRSATGSASTDAVEDRRWSSALVARHAASRSW